ncbi:hypothetical protein AYO45_05030 [Gammaproteobacteria bacterium SCGC AG-212-F23]|nr:hypothetical protein AYO45_05030 [Gammaproteobacteria bacterium SCGC AG-212-F23]
MKLSLQQLSLHLNQSLASIYLLSGDEPLLAIEASNLIKKTAADKGFSEHTRIHTEANNDWGKTLYHVAHSLSLFSTKQIIELNLTTIKFNQTNTKLLQEYAQQPANDVVLLIQTEKIDTKTEQTKWFQTIEKNSIFIPLWPIPANHLPQWILQRAKQLGLTITQDAAILLAEQVEGNLFAAAQEIEKLTLLNLSETIDKSTIENTITDNTRFDVFNLVDSILLGNSERALRILKNLFAEGIEPTLILWAITRELRTLADIISKQKQGINLTTLFSQHRIWEKRQGAVKTFLKNNTLETCQQHLITAAHIDRLIKGAETGNLHYAMETWITSL